MLDWFSFNAKKKQAPSLHNFSTIGIDIHSHILPGIDDGASDVNASIVLIKELISLGYNLIAKNKDSNSFLCIYAYNISKYKILPDWLNSDNWANPKLWEK